MCNVDAKPRFSILISYGSLPLGLTWIDLTIVNCIFQVVCQCQVCGTLT